MPPKKLGQPKAQQQKTDQNKQQQQTKRQKTNGDSEQKGNEQEPQFSEEEQSQERSKAAKDSLAAKKKAQQLLQAAAGAGDSKERQKLLKQALDKEVESESFGKLAKWLNSGALQGFAAGSLPGVGLGTLTGTLVGGVTSLITGGLGAGVGYLKGPAYSVGGVAAAGVGKLTDGMLEWNPDATEDQKKAVEGMAGQINEQDMPDDDELETFSAGKEAIGDGAKAGAKGLQSYMGGGEGEAAKDTAKDSATAAKDKAPSTKDAKATASSASKQTTSTGSGDSAPRPKRKPPKLEKKSA
ncbi:uncharacterized protein AB675_5335 [Cyphellophora attinorum]|uniref:Uncharacterized protein n=1 Tax=Cyphellophora attinorum TaxID=1664694 RepID=A0A0N0NP42_9EURO|nr:uncharacterized protein AB675_5335 [Phialophora attinorum]KPI42099.1 hypothetical protein AB675_5335 [Phialophora attinorum]